MAPYLFANFTSTLVFLLAMIVAIVILLRRSSRYFGKRSKSNGAIVEIPRPAAHGPQMSVGAPAECDQWEVHMHETARELSARIDSKMIALGQLIQDAEAKIARLESMLPQVQGLQAPESPRTAVADTQKPVSHDPQCQEIYSLADQGFSAVTIAHRVGSSLVSVESILKDR